MDRRTRSRGFTLIEAMVAVAVLGILMILAAPAMQKVVAKQRLRSASYDLVSDLTLARSEALKRGAGVVMEPLAAGNWAAGWQVRTADGVTRLGQRPALGVSIAWTHSPASITFDGAAQVTGGLTVKFGLNDGNGNHRCIELDPTGRPRSVTTPCT